MPAWFTWDPLLQFDERAYRHSGPTSSTFSWVEPPWTTHSFALISNPSLPSFLPERSRGAGREMERAAPVRSSHTSTAGLLAWPHPDGAGSLPARRPNQVTPLFCSPSPCSSIPTHSIVVDLLLFLARPAADGGVQEGGVWGAGHRGGRRRPQQDQDVSR